MSRAQPRDLPRELIDAVLRAPAATLPAFVGVELGDQGYAVVKITKVLGRDPAAAEAAKAMAQYAQVWADAESAGLLRGPEDALQDERQRSGVRTPPPPTSALRRAPGDGAEQEREGTESL